MEVVIIIFLILLLVVVGFLGYKSLRFMFKSKEHAVVTLSMCGLVVLIIGVNHIFFEKMQFIQSEVYSDLYLIKNPVKDKNELDISIKEFVMEQVNQELGNLKDSIGEEASSEYSLRFYRYSKSWNINLIADAGTAYFIENEEDPSGFVVEELSMYLDFKLAKFQMNNCENASEKYCGELVFYDKGEVQKKEILTDLVATQTNDSAEK